MENRIILAKNSQVGPMGRGQAGKKKVYEILIQENVVTFSWGMAEKTQRQVKRQVFTTTGQARQAALLKKWDKVSTGYSVVLEA